MDVRSRWPGPGRPSPWVRESNLRNLLLVVWSIKALCQKALSLSWDAPCSSRSLGNCNRSECLCMDTVYEDKRTLMPSTRARLGISPGPSGLPSAKARARFSPPQHAFELLKVHVRRPPADLSGSILEVFPQPARALQRILAG